MFRRSGSFPRLLLSHSESYSCWGNHYILMQISILECQPRADSALLFHDSESSEFGQDSCRRRQCGHDDVQQELLPAAGTPSKTTRQGQREKKTWKWDGGMETSEGLCYRASGLCEETDVSRVEGERWAHTRPVASAIAISPWDEQTDV